MKIVIECGNEELPFILVGLCEHLKIHYSKTLYKMAGIGLREHYRNTKEFDDALKKFIVEDTTIREDLTALYDRMKEFYPHGIKGYTTALWRGNRYDTVRNNLSHFFSHYYGYSADDCVNATEFYVKCFGDDTKYMKTLPRFIYDEQTGVSVMASVIDFMRENPDINDATFSTNDSIDSIWKDWKN